MPPSFPQCKPYPPNKASSHLELSHQVWCIPLLSCTPPPPRHPVTTSCEALPMFRQGGATRGGIKHSNCTRRSLKRPLHLNTFIGRSNYNGKVIIQHDVYSYT